MAQTVIHGFRNDVTSSSFNKKFNYTIGGNRILKGFRIKPGTSGLKVSFDHGADSLSAAYVNGSVVEETSALNDIVTFSAAHATLPRIDVVAVRYTWGVEGAVATYDIVPGTAAASPTAPVLTSPAYDEYTKLAEVTIRAAATSVLTSDIRQEPIYVNGLFVGNNSPTDTTAMWLDTTNAGAYRVKYHNGTSWVDPLKYQ